MKKTMLVDATHSEETRVAVIDDRTHKMLEFDYESQFRKPLKGSIFLAKVTRVEPSLQAAFVNFGGNRHGFLPFSEIHPDYFRIPIADREALIAEQEEILREAEEQDEQEDLEGPQDENEVSAEDDHDEDFDEIVELNAEGASPALPEEEEEVEEKKSVKGKKGSKKSKKALAEEEAEAEIEISPEAEEIEDEFAEEGDPNGNVAEASEDDQDDGEEGEESEEDGEGNRRNRGGRGRFRNNRRRGRGRGRTKNAPYTSRKVEVLGGTEYDDDGGNANDRFRFNLRRKYKIQEVIKRGQIMLIQVSREERGNKGAAVTTYLSLPGRYGVLMPNSPRAGGVSRKISNYQERQRMRETLRELEVPKGMSVILRTAGVSRTKTEIKRDTDYLMRLWNDIRELTLESSAPALIYEEADLIKRAVRDLYTPDVDEIIVSGEEGFKSSKKFMKMMIPSHVKRIKQYKDEKIPLFQKYGVEKQIAEIGETTARLKSGGYLVINPTEALVSIDVNSGRATKERHIEETALNTNMEAAEEVARQLKLRDLGGLVVIDFIDMEDRRNNAKVERKLKEALSSDRARIQLGRISSFGLLEMSRQRLNPSLTEAQFEPCQHCNGRGVVRTCDATVIMLLRALEEEGVKERAAELIVHVPVSIALYVLNNKRDVLKEIETRYGFTVLIRTDESMTNDEFRVEVSKPADGYAPQDNGSDDQDEEREERSDDDGEDGEGRRNRRRGRRGGRNRRGGRDRDRNRSDQDEDGARDDAEEQDQDVSVPEAVVETSEQEEKPVKGKSRTKSKSAPKKSTKQSDDEVVEDTQQEPAEATEEKPKKKAAAKKAPAKKSSKKDEEKAIEVSEASNDAAPPAKEEKPKAEKKKPAEPKEYEVVNEAPEKKKKGWWNL